MRVRTGGHLNNQRNKTISLQYQIELVNYWLAKQEPTGPRGYNFETLKKDKKQFGMVSTTILL